jgi:hypothetical protein
MRYATVLICAMLASGCQAAPPKDECDTLAKKYGANVVTIRDGGSYSGYARIRDNRIIWKSSKSDETKTVKAPNIWKLKLAIADEMRPGVAKNPNPPIDDPDNPFD